MIGIVDYGVGNLFSLKSSFAAIGQEAVVTGDPQILRSADRLILPGVGAFRDAAEKLRSTGLDRVICQEASSGKPLMGICLGMQLLFDKSYEYGEWQGLGLLKGEIRPIAEVIDPQLKIPHIGWNALIKKQDNPLLGRVKPGECVYFVHSYYAAETPDVIASTEYSAELTAAAARGNVYGCQFHPEKSGDTGLNILRAFCEDI